MVAQQFRLRPIMKQGTAASIPETWRHYPSVEDARAGAKLMYHNDRVLRVMIVTDSAGSFVEWYRAMTVARTAAGGVLLAGDKGLPHDLEALQDSAVLLTIAWPGGKRDPAESGGSQA